LQRLRSVRGVSRGDSAVKKHLYPEPRIALGRWLADHRMATSMMDLSDGLSTDLPRLCSASGVGARVEASRIPVVSVPRQSGLKNVDSLDLALNGGDDYELLFTVRPDKTSRVPRTFQGVAVTATGEIVREHQVRLVHFDGRETKLQSGGWDPFDRSLR
jgi:thiamine-monophosphate kinase